MSYNKDGFTLVELLIVIIVISILTGFSVIAYNGLSQRTRYSKILIETNQFRKKLELYKAENGAYPETKNAIPSGYILKNEKNKSNKEAIKEFEKSTGIIVPSDVFYFSNTQYTYLQPMVPGELVDEKYRSHTLASSEGKTPAESSYYGEFYTAKPLLFYNKTPPECRNPLNFNPYWASAGYGLGSKIPYIASYKSTNVSYYALFSGIYYRCNGKKYITSYIWSRYSNSRPPLYMLSETIDE